MKIVKVVVGKGRSIENGDKSWSKVNYELHAELEFEGEVEAAKVNLTEILDAWLEGKPSARAEPATSTIHTFKTKEKPEAPGIWTNRKKQPAEPGEWAWAFKDKVDPYIVAYLEDYEKGEWLKIGEMEYKLSGKNWTLVNRRPIKEK